MSDITQFLELDHIQGLLYIIVAVFAAVALIKAFGYLFEKFGIKTGAMIREETQEKEMRDLEEQQQKVAKDLDEIKAIIKALSSDINKIKTDNEKNEMRRKRRKILDMSDKIAEGRSPSKESVDDILEQYNEYENYIHENNLTNGRMDLAIQHIQSYYHTSFLQKEE